MNKRKVDDYWRGAENISPGRLDDLARIVNAMNSKELKSKVAKYLQKNPNARGTVDFSKIDNTEEPEK